MARLEDLRKGARVRGVSPTGPVTVIDADWLGADALTLTYEDAAGNTEREVLYRANEGDLELADGGSSWSLDADPDMFKLVAEAKRISLAYLFDPYLAAETSDIEVLPHQIEAVYGHMLRMQPLRFLLADDPGAGKTIMAGLLIKELMVRGDLERCLVVVPGGLAEQWQDELGNKFGLEFELLSREMVEASRSGNPLVERPLLVARLDMLARNEDLQARLAQSEWDLVVVDEAHKMSASFRGKDVKETQRYRLGKQLEQVARHFVLMTATPHNGKPEDFQLFMALLDSDRFAGKFRKGAHSNEPPKDLMRRMVKESLLRFDGTRLFPEREAVTAKYPLAPAEQGLYEQVTDYVRHGMNRAERLRAEGQGGRTAAVGFALTVLQRRLASSPLAIWRSIQRRRQRLSGRLAELLDARESQGVLGTPAGVYYEDAADFGDFGDFDDSGDSSEDAFDPEDRFGSELEKIEDEILDAATAARTVEELEAEIEDLGRLELLAERLYHSGVDRKWEELSSLLQNTPEMLNADGRRHKLIIFSEHRDTLEYLTDKLARLLGNPEAVVSIHGGIRREDRRKVQDRFTQDPDVSILVATDAAGEGLNLQRSHLMVNYDLPWNPNRIEQRFGRIHRIGQTNTCRLWNLVAEGTREGQVFERLLAKLEEQRQALGGKVFDVLGEAFSDRSLRDLLIKAIRSENPAVEQARLALVIDDAVGPRTRELIESQSLLTDVLPEGRTADIRDQMERARARKLQPGFVRSFFEAAFVDLGGRLARREPSRFQITGVPKVLRDWDKQNRRGRLIRNYERICFERHHRAVPGRPLADLVAPGHPLLDATIGVTLERQGALLQQGTILIDPQDWSESPRLLVFLEHEIVNNTITSDGRRQVVSRRFEYVEISESGQAVDAGRDPHIDLRAPDADEWALLAPLASADWVRSGLEVVALRHAAEHNAPKHLSEIEAEVHSRLDKTLQAVEQRLGQEISYWDTEALRLTDKAGAGDSAARLNSDQAKRRATEAEERLQRRRDELAKQRKLSVRQPRVVGGALVVPEGLVAKLAGKAAPSFAHDTARTDQLAVAAVLAADRLLGRDPKLMPHNNPGYDIETRSADGHLLLIEVKGRVAGADRFTVTKRELICGFNTKEKHILALVRVDDDDSTDVRYLYDPFTESEPLPSAAEFDRRLSWDTFWDRAEPPR